MSSAIPPSPLEQAKVVIDAGTVRLGGFLEVPAHPSGLVLFVHGSGSSRYSSRNRRVAEALRGRGLATLLFDLLTEEEERADELSTALRFDIPFLSARLRLATDWARQDRDLEELPVGYFGASTGAAAALTAAAEEGDLVRAIVSRGGRPDLAGAALPGVDAPTLLIVGGDDTEVLALNRQALARLQGKKKLEIVPGASHLFEEPGALNTVATLAGAWFAEHLSAGGGGR